MMTEKKSERKRRRRAAKKKKKSDDMDQSPRRTGRDKKSIKALNIVTDEFETCDLSYERATRRFEEEHERAALGEDCCDKCGLYLVDHKYERELKQIRKKNKKTDKSESFIDSKIDDHSDSDPDGSKDDDKDIEPESPKNEREKKAAKKSSRAIHGAFVPSSSSSSSSSEDDESDTDDKKKGELVELQADNVKKMMAEMTTLKRKLADAKMKKKKKN
jgi:hypothetical protein